MSWFAITDILKKNKHIKSRLFFVNFLPAIESTKEYCRFCKRELITEQEIYKLYHIPCKYEIDVYNSDLKRKKWIKTVKGVWNSFIDRYLGTIENIFIVSPFIILLAILFEF